jgi:aubergine-like protein
METAKEDKIAIVYPRRPNRDSNRDKVYRSSRVICNLRQINLGIENRKVQQYAIHYEPIIAEDNYPLKRKIIRLLSEDLKGYFERYAQAGDTIFVFSRNSQEKVSLEAKVDDVLYKVTFDRTANEVNCRNINQKTRDNIKIKSFIENIIKNIFMANNHMVRFDSGSFFDYNSSRYIGQHHTQIWSGYSTAVTITENGLFLRVNDKNKLITGKTVYDKFEEFHRKYGNMRSEECMRAILDYFKGKVVIAIYGNYRAYRIGDISFDRDIKNTEFEIEKEGKKEKIRIKDYYKRQYNIDLKHDDQPILIEEVPKRRREDEKVVVRYLIPELCYLTGIDELNDQERADIITKSKFQPSEKVKKIEQGFAYLKNKTKKKIKKKDKEVELRSPDEIRMEWGINIGDNFVEVTAQNLPLPKLDFDGKSEEVSLRYGRFRQQRDLRPVNFDKNNCMLITFDNLVGAAQQDCNQMTVAGRNLGVKFDLPHLEKIHSRIEEDLLNELRKINYNDGKKIAIVVLDRNTKNLYPIIKNFLYTQGGLTSQFMLHDENPKGGRKKQNLSYYSAVLNQMVVKAKGELFSINYTTKIANNPSMIIGIDTTMTKEGKKYVLSASYNNHFNKFYTDYKIERQNENALNDLIKSALNHFSSFNNGYLPKSVIIYRQGGNERQTEKLMRFDVPRIVKSFEEYKENYKPKLSIFGVNKKTDLKFFERDNHGYRNIPTGTVIDKDVISPELFEFYLQCPEVDKGTGSPVHFLCLFNNNDELTINDFEEITYRQSYYYWNWPGPIRIPAALKYAEVANNFCGKNIRGTVRENLRDSPYFI